MMQPTLIERVARSICGYSFKDHNCLHPDDPDIAGHVEEFWMEWVDEARALLRGLRQATPTMIRQAEAVYDAIFPADAVLADILWASMIDAAVDEVPSFVRPPMERPTA